MMTDDDFLFMKKAAESGDVDVMEWYGFYLPGGHGNTHPDVPEARVWLQIEQNAFRACMFLPDEVKEKIARLCPQKEW
jgi:hypothetical protein